MKSAMNFLDILLYSFIFMSMSLFAQNASGPIDPDDPTGTIETQLTTAVKNQFGNDYTLGFHVLDSVIARNRGTHSNSQLSDPYNTLKGCILFGADRTESYDNTHGIMGIYRNGQIVWHSEAIFKGEWGGIFSIKDINHDGKVELLEEWTPGMQEYQVRHLWIISWDGTTGTIINQIDSKTGNTTIHAQESMFELIAMDTISPLLIRAYWPTDEDFTEWFPNTKIATLPYVTYSWNGTQYGLWSSTSQIPAESYLPANLLKVTVNCSIVIQNDSLLYRYQINNAQNSLQSLSVVALNGLNSGLISAIRNGWKLWGYTTSRALAIWRLNPLEEKAVIPPGENIIIEIKSKGLPSVINYYTQGMRPSPHLNPREASPKWADDYLSDLFSNSFKGKIIAPIDPPSPFVPLNFLDTISSYIHKSHTLGWINNTRDDDAEEDENAEDGIVKNLDKRLDKVRDFIVKKKYDRVQNQLEKFLNKVEKLWNRQQKEDAKNKKNPKIIFTSEAYALLKYNAEYLQQQLLGKK